MLEYEYNEMTMKATKYNMEPSGSIFYQNIPSNTLPNRLVYLNQNHQTKQDPNQLGYLNQNRQTEPDQSSHVLINPHFKPKVFVNPNFNRANTFPHPTIHVNPSVSSHMFLGNVHVTEISNSEHAKKVVNNNIHINPNFPKIFVNPKVKTVVNTSSQVTAPVNTITKRENTNLNHPLLFNNFETRNSHCNNKTVVLTRTKLIREPVKTENTPSKKRRSSVCSRYKIIKSSSSKVSARDGPKLSRFKVDNRKSADKEFNNRRKYVFVNKFLSMKDLARSMLRKNFIEAKTSSILNISGVLFRKTPNKLRRTSISSIATKKVLNNTVKSKYKLIRKPSNPIIVERKVVKQRETRNSTVKRFKIIRSDQGSRNKIKLHPRLMKKCNIPCPYYRKFGKCKGKENGKCPRKHDSEQISLCTKFLQGACVDENCPLSHKVSHEKMPTCKYYLEGSCSRENCPYVHVKLSSKAEICRDFIEGFCKAGTECDKKHQYLCPDYEKYGKCGKQRCQYPHGKMVRKYLVNKQKFTKKCSETKLKTAVENKKRDKIVKNQDQIDRARYYLDRPVEDTVGNNSDTNQNDKKTGELEQTSDTNLEFRSRPKLGKLPSFIGFDES